MQRVCLLDALADGLDSNQKVALEQTLELLRTPEKRNAFIAKDSNAKAADQNLKGIAGTEQNTQKLYELAALLMTSLVEKSQGDPEKMIELLEKAQRDPASFAATFNDQQKAMLKEVATSVEKNKALH